MTEYFGVRLKKRRKGKRRLNNAKNAAAALAAAAALTISLAQINGPTFSPQKREEKKAFP